MKIEAEFLHDIELQAMKKPDGMQVLGCKKIIHRFSHEQLDKWQADILNELKAIPPNMAAAKNIFQTISNYIPLFCQINPLHYDHFKLITEGKRKEFFDLILPNIRQPELSDCLGSLVLDLIKAKEYSLAKQILTARPDASQEKCDENGDHAIHIAIKDFDKDPELVRLLCQHPKAFQVINRQNENVFQIVTNSFIKKENLFKQSNTDDINANRDLFFIRNFPTGFTPNQSHHINKFCHKQQLNIVLPYGVVQPQDADSLYKKNKHSVFSKHGHHHQRNKLEKAQAQIQNNLPGQGIKRS